MRAAIIAAASGLLLLGGAGVVWIAWEPELAPVTQAHPAPPPERLVRGAQLAAVGNCAACHTTAGGAPYAGGYAMRTPFGVIHATNITPDPETGIGTWSEAAFFRAMRAGVDREGRHLYPAFPYHFFARTSDADLRAIHAHLLAQTSVRSTPPENDLIFPLGFRPVIAGWKLLFHREGVFEADPSATGIHNRGAYLVAGLGHCGACHTPVNALGAPDHAAGLGGGTADGWVAPALTGDGLAPHPWSEAALARYLTHGRHIDHGAAAGPMRPVIASLAHAAEGDIQAIAHYLAGLSPDPAVAPPPQPRAYPLRRWRLAAAATTTAPMGAVPAAPRGDLLHAGLCASCHHTADPAILDWPRLSSATALHLDTPDTLIRVILGGLGTAADPPDRFMPAVRIGDADLAALLDHLRRDIAGRPAWPDLGAAIAAVREATP